MAILFAINLFVSIGLAGAVVFWLMKIHPITEEDTAARRRALSQILISLLALVIISVPVEFYMYERYMLEQAETQTGEAFRDRMPGYRVHEINRESTKGKFILHITLSGNQPPDPDTVAWIRQDMKKTTRYLRRPMSIFFRASYRRAISKPRSIHRQNHDLRGKPAAQIVGPIRAKLRNCSFP